MGVLHYILTHDWVDAFIQSALQVERVLTFLLSGPLEMESSTLAVYVPSVHTELHLNP